MGDLLIPKKGKSNVDDNEKYLVTSVISEDNKKEYFLYSDGNIYEKDEKGKLVKLDNVTPESKKVAQRIMRNFKPGKTDVIKTEKKTNVEKKEIEVDYPEL